MATGFGIDPVINASGTPISGTTAQDIRRGLTNGLYASPGVVYGFVVEPVKTSMKYTVGTGTAVVYMDGHVAIPGYGGSPTAPAGLTTHHVCVKQNNTSTDKSITYYVAGTHPVAGSGAICLAEYTVPKNATNLASAVRKQGADYATLNLAAGKIYSDTSLGYSGYIKDNTNKLTLSAKIGPFGTDRKIRIDVNYSVDKQSAAGVKQSEALYVDIKRDTKIISQQTSGLLTDTWTTTGSWFYTFHLPANTTTTVQSVWRTSSKDGNKKSSIYLRNGNRMLITDGGVMDVND